MASVLDSALLPNNDELSHEILPNSAIQKEERELPNSAETQSGNFLVGQSHVILPNYHMGTS
jgi:hypothetical protein